MSDEGRESKSRALGGPPARQDARALARELARLARKDPDALARRLRGVPLESQVELALRLSDTERLEFLLHAPKPMRLVRSLPDQDFYLTVRGVGPVDALPLLAMASPAQLQHLLDLESWRRDRFDAARTGAWVAALMEAGEPALARFLRHAEDEVLVLLFRDWLKIRPVDAEPDPKGTVDNAAGAPEGTLTPDGYYRFAPETQEHLPIARRLLERLMLEQPERYTRLLWAAQCELPSEVEEAALRWRQSRLEEHGFPPWDEAVRIYSPPRGVRAEAPVLAEGDERLPAPRTALEATSEGSMLAGALERLSAEEREGVLVQCASLTNHILVADALDTGDPQAHRRAARRMVSYVSLGLEARGARDASEAAQRLLEAPIVELFREGYQQAARVQDDARRFVEADWPSAHPRALELLDAPLRAVLNGLLQPRPLHFAHAGHTPSEGAGFRDFRSLDEIEQSRASLALIRTVGATFIERLGLDVPRLLDSAASAPGSPRFSTLLLTMLAWHATNKQIRCEPLPPDVAAQFVRTVASSRTASPDAPGRALDAFALALGEHLSLSPAETARLHAFGRASLERLRAECGNLDPGGPLDPRFVSCLLLQPPAETSGP